jgi:hypothetical protein
MNGCVLSSCVCERERECKGLASQVPLSLSLSLSLTHTHTHTNCPVSVAPLSKVRVRVCVCVRVCACVCAAAAAAALVWEEVLSWYPQHSWSSWNMKYKNLSNRSHVNVNKWTQKKRSSHSLRDSHTHTHTHTPIISCRLPSCVPPEHASTDYRR